MMHAAKRSSRTTQERILDAAEALIIENGYAGTSLRAIAARAGANLAATHYHFGSKKGLFAAVFHRRMGPVGEARLLALDKLQAGRQTITVKAVLRAFFDPLYCADQTDLLDTLPSLVGRIYGEPESLTKPMLEQEFTEVASRYQTALGQLLPNVPPAELRWRFHFMIGAMIQLLRFQSPLGVANADHHFIEGLDHLIEFTTAGLQQCDSRANTTEP